jgi:peptidoglycan/LPS O-acetylase OafA/YrhL
MNRSRSAALDGLRGAAVLLVILYHFWRSLPTGGFVGVDIFLVLSGYLITSLILGELEAGTFRFGSFYLRRAVRFAPALWATVLLTTIAVGALSLDTRDELPGDLVWVLTYTSNWKRAFVEHFGGSRFFLHTWSLGIEAQFYLTWPFLLVAAYERISRRRLLTMILAAIAAVAIYRWTLLFFGSTTFRIYHGYDTRIDELLVGCALAMALSIEDWRANVAEWLRTRPFLSATLLAAMPFLGAYMSPDGATLAIFGYTLLAVTAAVIIVDCRFNPASLSARLLSWPPLARLGIISYGVYLWHLPIMAIFATSGVGFGFPQQAVGLLLVLAIASLSHHGLERPLLQWSASRRAAPAPRSRNALARLAFALACQRSL